MTIWDVLNVAGAVAGLAVLAVMALVPVLLALPVPRPAGAARHPVAVPAQRAATSRLRVHSAA